VRGKGPPRSGGSLRRAGRAGSRQRHSPVNLDETVAHILAEGGQVKAYVEDIAKKMPVQTLLNAVLDDFQADRHPGQLRRGEPQKSCWRWMTGTGSAPWT